MVLDPNGAGRSLCTETIDVSQCENNLRLAGNIARGAFPVALGKSAHHVILAMIPGWICHESGQAWPSRSTIAKACGLCSETVAAALAELERAGLLRVAERHSRRGIMWQLTVPAEHAKFAFREETQVRQRATPCEKKHKGHPQNKNKRTKNNNTVVADDFDRGETGREATARPSTARVEVIDVLRATGVLGAEQLASHDRFAGPEGADEARRLVRAASAAGATNPAGWIKAAIERGWDLPAARSAAPQPLHNHPRVLAWGRLSPEARRPFICDLVESLPPDRQNAMRARLVDPRLTCRVVNDDREQEEAFRLIRDRFIPGC